ncbi:MAG: protocatechuate 3,4-dioxygenase subunit alpha [Allomuricauda sp.]|nr:MAG: protocatechuate 3,4-dioxygenase subunit alpha [Allomuricauda sp.]
MNILKQTPSQTVGPYFAYGLTPNQYHFHHKGIADNNVFSETILGERIYITGRVLDGKGATVLDAMIELRQNSPQQGFARFGTGTLDGNRFVFNTVKPKSDEKNAPHINVVVMMRGLLSHVFTRIYFSDEGDANANDPVLKRVPEDRKDTLIAQRKEVDGKVVYEFDIHMQGKNETVFFDA